MSIFLKRVLCAVALAVCTWGLALAPAYAEDLPPAGYVVNPGGDFYRDGQGDCWHTPQWTKDMALKQCEPGLVSQPPAKVAALDKQEPIKAEPQAPAKVLAKITLDAKTNFGFDKTALTPAAERRLDRLISKVENTNQVLGIHVTGYTDRLGPSKYNEKLGLQRAQSVKDYLAKHGGSLQTNGIEADSKGENNPVVRCDSVSGFQKLVGCLGPNRRVVVEVTAQALRKQTQ